ncbi:MAG: hypothetical protein PHW96_02240 [Candidatus Nanoarchaeia archaeon]|nr:hypothetical protein [Candidatus Nanoarchaeia archaeon]
METGKFTIQRGEDVISGYDSPSVFEARCGGDSCTYQRRLAIDRSFLFRDFYEVVNYCLQDNEISDVLFDELNNNTHVFEKTKMSMLCFSPENEKEGLLYLMLHETSPSMNSIIVSKINFSQAFGDIAVGEVDYLIDKFAEFLAV